MFHLHRRFLAWTTMIVVVMGFAVTLTLLDSPEQSSPRRKRKSASQTQLVESSREPASVNANYKTMVLDETTDHMAVDLIIKCKGETSAKFANDVIQVRVNGDICSKAGEVLSTEIVNETNGFSATVFFPTPRSYMSDYITLAPGENQLRILHNFKKGGREQRSFTITR